MNVKKITVIFEVLTVKVIIFLIICGVRLTPLWEWQRTYLKSEFINSALMF